VALGAGGAGGCLDTQPFFSSFFCLDLFLAACTGSILDLYLLFLNI
jgi:hypothetical protein